jgi:type II secretory pathway component PulL
MGTHGVTKRRKFEWITAFDKCGYIACALLAVVLALIHFRTDLSALQLSSAVSHDEHSAILHDKHDVLAGSILAPYANDVCHQRLIDNATGQIRDGGLVNCEIATAHNTEMWADARKAFQNR